MEKARGKSIDVPEIEPMTSMIFRAGEQYSQFDYVTALEEMHAIGRTMGRFQQDYDVILQPVTATPAPKLKTIIYREGDTLEQYTRRFKKVSAYTHLYNMSGQPSMSLPLAFSENGLPVGVMLSGRVGADALLFSLAAQIEASELWTIPLPPVNASVSS
jgi:amidase